MAFIPLLLYNQLQNDQNQQLALLLGQKTSNKKRFEEDLQRQWQNFQLQTHAVLGVRSLRLQQREIWKFPRSGTWWDRIAKREWGDASWQANFRMSIATFDFIVEKLKADLEKQVTRFREPIPVDKRVAIALWRLATGNEFRSISQLFGVGISTALEIVEEFVLAVNRKLKPIYCIYSNFSLLYVGNFGIEFYSKILQHIIILFYEKVKLD